MRDRSTDAKAQEKLRNNNKNHKSTIHDKIDPCKEIKNKIEKELKPFGIVSGTQKNMISKLKFMEPIYADPLNIKAFEDAAIQQHNDTELAFYKQYREFKKNPNYADFQQIYADFVELNKNKATLNLTDDFKNAFKLINKKSSNEEMLYVLDLAAGNIANQLKQNCDMQYNHNQKLIEARIDHMKMTVDQIVNWYENKPPKSKKDRRFLKEAKAAQAEIHSDKNKPILDKINDALTNLMNFEQSKEYFKLTRFELKENHFSKGMGEFRDGYKALDDLLLQFKTPTSIQRSEKVRNITTIGSGSESSDLIETETPKHRRPR